MTAIPLSFQCRTSCESQLMLSVEFDGKLTHDCLAISRPCTVEIPFLDQGDHQLRITLSGKTAQHTELDSQDKIVRDCVLILDHFCLDGIDITPHFYRLSRYWHDFNGTGTLAQHCFYGSMGCNGSILFDFSSPMYPWILANAA